MDEAAMTEQQGDNVGRPACPYCGERYTTEDVARHTKPAGCVGCGRCSDMPACYTCRNMYCGCETH